MGGQAPKWVASLRSGRVLERMLSRPRAPGKRPAKVRGRRELSVLEGRAKEKTFAESIPGRLESLSGSDLEKDCFWTGLERSRNLGECN